MNLYKYLAYLLLSVLLGCMFTESIHGNNGPGDALQVDAGRALEQLRKLEGTWEGTTESDQSLPTKVLYHVTANGSAVMETLFPGTPHEMISMCHLDGKNLVLTHYCAAGNQPRMKLASAKADELAFDFTGGTNLDASKDTHIHSGKITFLAADRLKEEWIVYQDGKPAGTNRFFLNRKNK
jgi:hypothetical protein